MISKKPLTVGIVGTGWVAGAHIDAFRSIPDCTIVAVSSRSLDKAKAKIATHSIAGARAYDRYEDLLNHDGLDIVSICTPHPSHPAETIAAAKAGKHIVIEKPVSLDRANLEQMMAAVADAKVLTSVCFELRWIGLFKNIKAMMAQGLLGDLFYGETSYFHGLGPWYAQWAWNIKKEMGGSAMLTAGCHAIDALVWLVGSRVAEVSAMASTSKHNPLKFEYDPNTVALLQFESGVMGKVAASLECRQPYLFPVLLQGEKGTIWNDHVSTLEWPGMRGWATIPTALPDSGDVNDHPYRGQFEYFLECIRSGTPPHNDLANASHVHEIMFAIEEAVLTKRTVAVRRTPRS
ncbi:MAG: Gfo/Idh/MocA family oxidoreductase [Planctomycetota bacterium]|jgi:predicted dehydrogenase|nr:Gfo/Idh/MocA family oxidoreductase [Planctomycetia bacterium]MDO7678763.1 Gfo/Idh/MocA family oxidoreductase [Pirellulales bacterium]RLS29481.1 MAG: gfo/Idh/MocA family oxidoreductase [Planctomycetota bacterium]TSA03814.1 MAG: gfo/Idh/MocA family oxidoreductase [Planctomycetaceae bacterium]RLS60702.1 MAG: gfo/Idh/MocA family oxidoreductase [Planctomycetota bacterium]